MATQEEERKSLMLRVIDARPEDIGRGIAKLAPEELETLGLAIGDMISLMGKRRTVAKAMRTYVKDTNKGFIALDQVLRANAQTALAEQVTVQKIDVQTAQRVVLSPVSAVPAKVSDEELKELLRLLEGLPVVGGDRVRPNTAGFKNWEFSVTETVPEGAVIIRTGTALTIKPSPGAAQGPRKVTYKDIGGMNAELQQVREVVELPLKYPQLFDRLGIDAPKGVLLFGPPGCGKTMTARAVASETSAHFIHISGPEIVHRYYGDSEAHLREVFKEARDRAPTIIFFDEIDAIASKREDVSGDVEKRIVAQLMALLDGLESRGQVIVVAATNIPDSVDPALRRPGRFDREISVRVPDREGRSGDSADSHPDDAFGQGCRFNQDRRGHPRLRRSRSESPLPGSGDDHPEAVGARLRYRAWHHRGDARRARGGQCALRRGDETRQAVDGSRGVSRRRRRTLE